jgi:hypothetical protein
MNMNRHERLYRKTVRVLYALLALWVAVLLLPVVTPASLWRTRFAPLILLDGVVPLLILAVAVVSTVNMVAYMRWTGKYPYYFLFRKSRATTSKPTGGGSEGVPPEGNRS